MQQRQYTCSETVQPRISLLDVLKVSAIKRHDACGLSLANHIYGMPNASGQGTQCSGAVLDRSQQSLRLNCLVMLLIEAEKAFDLENVCLCGVDFHFLQATDLYRTKVCVCVCVSVCTHASARVLFA